MAQCKYNLPLKELTELSWDDYEDCKPVFTYCLQIESRQINYNNDIMQGSMNVRIFWADESRNLGYALFDDWKAKKIRFYRVGSDKKWRSFNREFAAQFVGDNS